MESLKDKIVVVTDALSPVGVASVQVLGGYGACLVLCGGDQKALDDLAKECPTQVCTFAMTGNQECDIKQVVKQAINEFRKIDGLAFTTETTFGTDFEESTAHDLNEALRLNVEPLVYWYQQSMTYLRKTKGSIVAVSSGASKQVLPGQLPFAVSKAGLDQLTRCIALEMASYGVRANSLNPCMRKSETESSETQSLLQGGVTPHDVAEYLAFLLSDGAGFVTGSNIMMGDATNVPTMHQPLAS